MNRTVITMFNLPQNVLRIIYQFDFMKSEYDAVLDQMLKQETALDVVLDQLQLKYDHGFWWLYGGYHVTPSRRFNVQFTTEDEYDNTFNVQKNKIILLQDLMYNDPIAVSIRRRRGITYVT